MTEGARQKPTKGAQGFAKKQEVALEEN